MMMIMIMIIIIILIIIIIIIMIIIVIIIIIYYEKDELLKMQCEQVRESLPSKTERAVELATEKGASNWLTVIPIKEMNFNLNKR